MAEKIYKIIETLIYKIKGENEDDALYNHNRGHSKIVDGDVDVKEEKK